MATSKAMKAYTVCMEYTVIVEVPVNATSFAGAESYAETLKTRDLMKSKYVVVDYPDAPKIGWITAP